MRVSILARPEGRALRMCSRHLHPSFGFQSSPGPKAGRYQRRKSEVAGKSGFNPRPARRPGATRKHRARGAGRDVSILARPEGRALPKVLEVEVMVTLFQSSPGPKAGRYRRGWCSSRNWSCFNPRPARRPGATSLQHGDHVLLRGFNPRPARRPGATATRRKLSGPNVFQSSPGPKAGRYEWWRSKW